jgi:hypothetical protein
MMEEGEEELLGFEGEEEAAAASCRLRRVFSTRKVSKGNV